MKTLLLLAALFVQDPKPPSIEYGNRRESKAWVETPGGSVAVDEGIEWKGRKAYLSLTGDLVVVDVATGKTAWSAFVGSFWNRMTFEKLDDWTVALRPRDGEQVQHHDLATGKISGPKPAVPPGKPIAPRVVSGSGGVADEAFTGIVSSADGWKETSKKLFGDAAPDPGAVDFAKECLLVVYGGKTSNCRGVGLDSAVEDDARILLRLARSTYQSMGEGPVERPYGIFVLPRAKKTLVLESNAQRYLGGPAIWKESRRLELPGK